VDLLLGNPAKALAKLKYIPTTLSLATMSFKH
jgi:hypothetical protein